MDEKTHSQLKIIIILVCVLFLVGIAFFVANFIKGNKSDDNSTALSEVSASGTSSQADTDAPVVKDETTTAAATQTASDEADASLKATTVPPTKADKTDAPATLKATDKPSENETKAPTDKPSKQTTAPTKAATKNPTKKPTKNPTKDTSNVSMSDVDKFLSDTVFVGDSVMYGFELYCERQKDGFMGNPTFLAEGCFSTFHALSNNLETSIQPKYNGVKRHIWDSISLIDPSYVFLFFGFNDLGAGVDKAYSNYVKVIENILDKNEYVNIVVISTTPMYAGSEKGKLNNDNINDLNSRMKTYVESIDGYYLDIASQLKKSDGTLDGDYSSDHYVHETNAAYKIWEAQIRNFAAGFIE